MHKIPASKHNLEKFFQGLPWSDLEIKITPYFESKEKASDYIKTIQAEARMGLNLISSSLLKSHRVLEVGSGMGLLAGYLSSLGFNITALEPGLGGFGISRILAEATQCFPGFASLERLHISAERLSKQTEGEFDFIYSVNVLEHIPNLEETICAMGNVLSEKGVMVHTCPNYAIPYEPHFGIPLVPVAPRLTIKLLPKSKDSELWKSLNFITATRLIRACRAHDLIIELEPGVMLRTFTRFDTDPEFRRRQGNSFVFGIFLFLKLTGLLYLLGKLPASWSTPMVAKITHRKSKS
jgi:2-polyprenyl-3-methyl-5-hydroxy-6-metoxy-1,4-benzoquinol methylase